MATAARTSSWIVPHRWLRSRDLLRELIYRDIKLRYHGSVLGILWTLLNPLAELFVLLFVFGIILRTNIENFPAYLFTGLLVYGWFQTSVNFATMAVVGNRELVRRPGVPILVLPVVTVASNLVHFVLSLPILLGLLAINSISLTTAIIWLPLLIAIEFLLILGFAYPVATINVWFRDTQHVLRIVLQLLFYLTPVFYERERVPKEFRWLTDLNPLSHMVDAYRAVLLRGASPAWDGLAFTVAVSAVLCIAGMLWYRRAGKRFADEL